MAINVKIVQKIKSKTTDDSKQRRLLTQFLARIEEGRQPKRVIDNIMNELKSDKLL